MSYPTPDPLGEPFFTRSPTLVVLWQRAAEANYTYARNTAAQARLAHNATARTILEESAVMYQLEAAFCAARAHRMMGVL